MCKQDHRDCHAQPRRRRRRVWLIAISFLVLAAAGWLLWMGIFPRHSRTADERLAEIEAARAIPDSENAATVYNELLQDPNATSLADGQPDSLVTEIYGRALHEPWFSNNHPELAAWVRKYQSVIDRLLKAMPFDKCRFRLVIDVADTTHGDRVRSMRRWGFLLAVAANNDIAEGRIDDATTKWQCLLRMEDHLRQQPDIFDQLLANHLGELALQSLVRFITTGNHAERHLQKMAALPLPMRDHWAEYDREARVTDALIVQRVAEQIDLLSSLRHPIEAFRLFRVTRAVNSLADDQSRFDTVGDLYRRNIATARGIRILVALRRYKDTNGRWPARLQEIQTRLPEEALTDPCNKGSFVYRLTPDGFRLYSRGQNNVDEEGTWDPDNGPDDWPIWPPRGRSPEMKQKDADSV
jgi:hypothetical protein